MKETLEDYKWLDTEMSVVPAPAAINKNIQAVMPKNIILDLLWTYSLELEIRTTLVLE